MAYARKVRVEVLGHVSVSVDGRPLALAGFRPRQVLSRLALEHGRPVEPEVLRRDLWGDDAVGIGTIKTTVGRLRRSLGEAADVLVSDYRGYALDGDRVSLDVRDFSASVTAALREGDPWSVAEALGEALALWRGEPYADLDCERAHAETRRLIELRDQALERRVEALLAIGSGEDLISELTALAERHPHRERIAIALSTALYRSGRQVDALATLRRHGERLRDDLGLDSSEAVSVAEHRILVHDASLTAEPRPVKRHSAGRSTDVAALLRSSAGLISGGAFGEAAVVARRAVSEARADGDVRLLVRALCRAAIAYGMDGAGDEAWAALGEATAAARSVEDADALAETALTRFAFGAGFEGDRSMLYELAEPLSMEDLTPTNRVALLCAGVYQIALARDSRGADALLDEARTVVAGDRRTPALIAAANALRAGLRDTNVGKRVRLERRSLVMATKSSDPLLEATARLALARTQLLVGAVEDVADGIELLARSARRALQPIGVVRARVLRHAVDLARGTNLEGLSLEIAHTTRIGRGMGVASTEGSTQMQLMLLSTEMLDISTLRTVARAKSATDPRPGVWDGIVGLAAAVDGDLDGARDSGHAVATALTDSALVGWQRTFCAAAATEIARACRDARLADVAAAELTKRSGQFVVAGHSTVLLGPVDRYLGLARLAHGDVAGASVLLEQAAALCEDGGAWIWRCRSQIELAGARALGGSHAEASRLLDIVEESMNGRVVPRLRSDLGRARANLDARHIDRGRSTPSCD